VTGADVPGAGATDADTPAAGTSGAGRTDREGGLNTQAGLGVTELDCLGQRCPLPVIALARRLPELPVGAVLRVLADDPAAGNDIAAWCRMRGHEFLGSPTADTFDVRRLT
jgi:tRNA 2-thiouridine synthesizing protein A